MDFRRRDDTIPEETGNSADGPAAVIDVIAVDLFRLDDRCGEFVVELVLIVYHLALIHGHPPYIVIGGLSVNKIADNNAIEKLLPTVKILPCAAFRSAAASAQGRRLR